MLKVLVYILLYPLYNKTFIDLSIDKKLTPDVKKLTLSVNS